MISPEVIEQVKSRIQVVEVLSRYLDLKRDGVNWSCKCPFHKEKSPSFKVSKEKGIYKCFGCSKTGDAVQFIMDFKGVGYIDAIKTLASFYHVDINEGIQQKRVYAKPTPKTVQPNSDLIKWFDERGIKESTIEDFKVTFVKEWMPKAQTEVPTICFNYYRNEELVNIKYRAENRDFKLSKGAELIFYNIDSIKDRDYVIITEGEIDCMTVSQCGLPSVISVPNGAAKGTQKLEYLDNCFEIFDNITSVILMVDNDECGNLLREELARRIGKERCKKVVYPDGCKDANDVLLKHGKEQILSMCQNAVEYPIEGIITMDEMYDDVSNYYLNGYPTGVKLGIEGLDEYISIMEGQFTTVTGIPGSGKSEFTDLIMVKCALNHGWNWAVCSFENQPSSIHVTKLMEKIVGKSFAFRQDHSQRINQEEFMSSAAIVDYYFNFININQVDVTLDGILNKAKELVLRKGIKGLLIDPWNYIEHKIANNQTETQYISECLTKIKAFALTYGIHIFLIAHPTKLKKENNKYEVPTMYSISGSAHFFNKTDNGLTIYRNFDTNTVTLYVQKIRYSWLGKIGYCEFNYNTDTRQYQSVNNSDIT